MSKSYAAPFDAETITLMREVLETVVAAIPVAFRTSPIQAMLAERILKYAAQGERDRIKLLDHALLDFDVQQDAIAQL
jgi:hypothetical protein